MNQRRETDSVIEYFEKYLSNFLVFKGEIPYKEGNFKKYKFNFDKINEWVDKNKIKFYSHQVLAWQELDKDNNIVISTPTASGKSLIYFLKIIEQYYLDNKSTFLLIYPTRALLNDQYYSLINLCREIGIKIPMGKFYGDEKRKGSIIFTTVDTLHINILKNNIKWEDFLKNLKYIVIDELHQYSGIFGSVSAYVFERLRIITELLGAKYKIICCSATIPNASSHVKIMFNRDFVIINESGAPEPKRTFLFFNPSRSNKKDLSFLEDVIKEELRLTKHAKILSFFESRKQVEQVYRSFLEMGIEGIAPYKGTYTKLQRHKIERDFKENKIRCLFSTNALELGINIGNLDIVNNLGIPGSGIASLLQRFGRSGRDYKRHSLNILIFRINALDQYYARNPDELFEKIKNNKSEYVIINKENKKIKIQQLKYLLYEINRGKNIKYIPKYLDIDFLKNNGIIIESENIIGEKTYMIKNILYKGLRSIDEEFYLINKENNKIIEKFEKYSIFNYLLPGMIYFSFGRPYIIKEIDFKDHKIFCEPYEPDYGYIPKTYPISSEDIEILDINKSKTIFKDITVKFGKIRITKKVHGYTEGNVYVPYESPYEYVFETESLWLEFPYQKLEKLQNNIISELYELYYNKYGEIVDKIFEISPLDLFKKYPGRLREILRKKIVNEFIKSDVMPNDVDINSMILLCEAKNFIEYGLHTIEHGIINIAPVLFALDNREMGGRSFLRDLEPLIFVYDAIPNGIGYSKSIFKRIEDILRKSLINLTKCDCELGCPKCVFSPRCGNQNDILNKKFGIEILKTFLE